MVIKLNSVYLTVLVLILSACQTGGTKTKTVSPLPSQTPYIFTQISPGLDTPFIPTKTPVTTPAQYTTPLASTTSTQVSLPNPTNEGISVSSINILTPKISPAYEIIDSLKISSFFLQHAYPETIALDNKYVYWVDHGVPQGLYRIPQRGGTPEIVAKSLYASGRLDCLDMQSSAHWLIFCDADTPGIPGNWQMRAINLDDLSQTILFTSEDPQLYVISSFSFSLDGDSVIWAVTTQKNNQPDEYLIEFVDLATGEKRELLRQRVDTWGWSSVSLSVNQAVIQQSYDETQQGTMLLHLLDVTNGMMTDLLTDEKSTWPAISFPWVTWTQLGSNGYPQTLAIYNLVDHRQWRIPSQGTSSLKPGINGSWVYWKDQGSNGTGNAIYI